MAEEHKMKYEQLMNTAYGNLKLQAKIEVVKQRQPLQTEPEDEEEELKIDALNDDEEEIRMKVRLNLRKKNLHIFTQEEVQSARSQAAHGNAQASNPGTPSVSQRKKPPLYLAKNLGSGNKESKNNSIFET